jgi:hypothetical protein
MAKQGQHKNDNEDHSKPGGHEKSKGHNNPSKSQTITTGTYKKKETYARQAAEHEDPHKQPQAARNEWNEEIREERPAAEGQRGRSGSDSNASASTRGH